MTILVSLSYIVLYLIPNEADSGLHRDSGGEGSYSRNPLDYPPRPTTYFPLAAVESTSGNLFDKPSVAYYEGALHTALPDIPYPIKIEASATDILSSSINTSFIACPDNLSGHATESEVEVEYHWRPERYRSGQKLGHRAAHSKPKSVYWPTVRILSTPVAKPSNSAHNHPKSASAPIAMILNHFEVLHFDDEAEDSMISDENAISRDWIARESDHMSHVEPRKSLDPPEKLSLLRFPQRSPT
ncbi:hypothetical protein Nepgr_031814 [Nepenthes gracilis]|uniref:Uncharacterized protein n=1 Tax=Nepenthes gracilis TaxID=150966 RepID=A0AAD3Y7U1_NEPGR|nr:hypothetical protein Nepgr_031814 [Nepenthes gracilis]